MKSYIKGTVNDGYDNNLRKWKAFGFVKFNKWQSTIMKKHN
jgi:hypothetical protein